MRRCFENALKTAKKLHKIFWKILKTCNQSYRIHSGLHSKEELFSMQFSISYHSKNAREYEKSRHCGQAFHRLYCIHLSSSFSHDNSCPSSQSKAAAVALSSLSLDGVSFLALLSIRIVTDPSFSKMIQIKKDKETILVRSFKKAAFVRLYLLTDSPHHTLCLLRNLVLIC